MRLGLYDLTRSLIAIIFISFVAPGSLFSPGLFSPCIAAADGFFIDPQSAEGMGMAQAGAAVGYRDGSAGYYNPAALVTYTQPLVSMQLHAFNPSAKFTDYGSTVAGEPNTGPNQADGGRDAALPLLYSAMPLSERMTGSLYVNSPFGLGTEYPEDWIGRYQAVESSLRMVNLGGAVGVDLGSGWSVGGGMSAIYADATLSTAIDFGSIGFAALGPEQASALGLRPQQNDGLVKVKASDWAMGWNTGVLYRYGDQRRNRVGLSYRGRSDLHFHNGDADFRVPESARLLTAGGAFSDTGARATVTLPEMVTFGTGTHLSDSVVLFQQSTWTHWSRVKDLTVEFDNPLQPASAIPQDWNDSWFHSIGLAWRAFEQVELRCGVGYENGIVPNASRRYPRLPTSDSVWGSAGVGLDFPETGARFDLSYTRLEYRGGYEDSVGATGDRLRGDWKAATNALSSAVTLYW